MGPGSRRHERGHVECRAHYDGYLKRQEAEVARYRGAEERTIPDGFSYRGLSGLSAEIVEKLTYKLGLDRYSIYLMDYGAPVGFRLALRHPQRVQALIIQNGNAYDEGLREFWEPIKAYWNDKTPENAEALRGLLTIDATKWQYTHGVRNIEAISPDNWNTDQPLLDRPGNAEIQLALFYDYRTNVPLYSPWQEYFQTYQPPTLIVWGKNDPIFPAEGAHPYKRDLRDLEFHLLDTGHFALEEDGDVIAELIRSFLKRKVFRGN